MDGRPEHDKELSLSNTPLENLRTILSEADASAQTEPAELPAAASKPSLSKGELRRIVEQLRAAPQQFLSPEAVAQMVQPLSMIDKSRDVSGRIFENEHVLSLEKWIQKDL